MLAPGTVHDGGSATFQFFGAVGERIEFLMTRGTRSRFLPAVFGVRVPHEGPPMPVTSIGTVPPGGSLTQSWSIPLLPSGERATRWFIQPAFIDAQGQAVLGTPQAVFVIDHTL